MFMQRLKSFFRPFDQRYEDLARGNLVLNVLRDFTAGLVVAAIAIPLAMGLAMALGLRPEQGIVGGAVAGLVGAVFGGSKYQVYGPTAAFIPIIGAIMVSHSHGFLVLCSMVAGVILWIMALSGLGRFVKLVPHSIVVGFTIGIAVTIGLSQGMEMLGVHAKTGYGALEKLLALIEHFGELKLFAVLLAIGTVIVTKLLLRVSVYIPAPLVALGGGAILCQTVLVDSGLDLVRTKFGSIPAQALTLTLPAVSTVDAATLGQVAYYSIAIVFVAAIESLLCSRMADRLAGNKGTPFNADKELWGQGHVMFLVPLLNGFPHTGALARTATNIKLGAVSPLAGIFKAVLKLILAFYLAQYLELVPMACIGGILLYVAMNMVKPGEVEEVVQHGRGHVALMVYTALAVVGTDFLRGVLSALAIYGIWTFVQRSRNQIAVSELEVPSAGMAIRASIGQARKAHTLPGGGHVQQRRKWMSHIGQPGSAARSAFVHHKANLIGRVVLGEHVHIAAGASVRADEGSPFHIGSNSNIQDGVVIHALEDRHVLVHGEPWAVFIGQRVSVAHDALVHGPCFIGDDTFVGFKAVIHDSVVHANCFVGIGSIVVGVEVPEGRAVPPGAIIDTQAKADKLGPASAAQHEFNEDVVVVNRGLAAAYRETHAAHTMPASHVVEAAARPAVRIEPTWGGTTAGWGPPPASSGERF